ncbi:hypothetical protein BC835DRAFT_720915 [Cytidiella melzeri]|nr:hypothetical protein BC835DRAFT_720915 [Cytidiella melzeri]
MRINHQHALFDRLATRVVDHITEVFILYRQPRGDFNWIKLHPHVVRVCSGLIYALACLHRLPIARCAIKPAKMLLGREFCPKIIDCDCAIQLKDEDGEVVGVCKTEGWMVPEVSDSAACSPTRSATMLEPVQSIRFHAPEKAELLVRFLCLRCTLLLATSIWIVIASSAVYSLV